MVKLANFCLPDVAELSEDLFASAVLRRFLDLPSSEFRSSVAESIKGHMFDLSKHDHGCRVGDF